LLWTVVIGIAFLVVQTVAVVFYIAFTMRPLPPRDKMQDALGSLQFDGRLMAVCSFATLLVCVPVIIGIVKLKRGSVLKSYLGFTLPSFRQVWRWSLATVAVCLLADGILSLFHQAAVSDFMLKTYTGTSQRWILWLALVVAAPVFEEICFRGFIFKGLAASRLRWQGATLITALLWTAIHVQYDWYGLANIFIFGLLLGTVRAMTNSTVLTMFLHSLINLLATLETAIALGRL
jgi:membrane protease YdiL (CAAX protease family)